MYIGFGIVASSAYYFFLRRENARRDKGEREEVIEGVYLERMGADGRTEKESEAAREERARRNGRFASLEAARTEKGDDWSGYRYTL